MCDLALTIFSLHNKVIFFQRDIDTKYLQHFPFPKGLVDSENDLCSEKVKVYVESLQGASTYFATRFSDQENLKPTFVFLVNPFVVEVVKDECPVQKPVITQAANVEAGLLDLQQDFALKSVHQSQSTVEFWKLVSVVKYPTLRQTSQQLLSILGQHIAVSPCTLP